MYLSYFFKLIEHAREYNAVCGMFVLSKNIFLSFLRNIYEIATLCRTVLLRAQILYF